MKYTIIAWLVDKRCNDNCRIVSYDTETIEDAKKWVKKIKKAYGDSVKLIDNENHTEGYIELNEEQRA